MEYSKLSNLENTYPQTANYIVSSADASLVSLYGLYADKNKLDFKLPSLKELKFVPNTNFRFILAIFKDYKDTNPVYYTSQKYFNDLQSAQVEGNFYFLQSSFSNSNIVSYVYEDVVKMAQSMRALEMKSRIDFRINVFAGISGSVDYDNLVTYIDWLVDKQSPLDDINFGVLEPTTIAGWNALDGNFATGEVKTTISASYGIGSQFVSVLGSAAAELEAELKLEREKLEKIKKQIDAINLELKTKSKYQYPSRSNAFTTVEGVTYTAINDVSDIAKFLGINKDRREKAISERLTQEINLLNSQKISAEKAVGEAQNKLNAAKAAASDAVNKAKEEIDKLKGAAGDLINKIPKIPKLPPVPKIPKLPSITELGAIALAALPVLPALPKLPSLPKKPSFKLPPLKLFKPKKPKEPKKVKKNKGKGLKGALGDLQNAVNSAQGAVAGAAAAAAEAVAAAQATANQATSAVANAQSAVANAQSAVKGAVDGAKGAVQGAVDSAKSSVQSTIDAGKDAVKSASNNIPKV